MSAGAFPAGIGAAGHAPVLDPSEAVRSRAPQAPLYDLAIKDFRRNADGTYTAVHPVDAEVQNRLGLEFGTIASAAEIGNAVPAIRYLAPSLEREVKDRVKTALAPMIARGDIRLKDVVVERRRSGFVYAVIYVNLQILPAQEQTVGTR